MARTLSRLSDRQVKSKSLAPGLYHDGGGLYLQVTPGGGKSWFFRFKRNGKARDMGLGSLTVVGLAEARQKAEEARKLHGTGKDPIEEKAAVAAQEARQRASAAAGAVTFKQAAQDLIASLEAGWRNPKHRQQWKNTLEAYAYPVFGDVAVAQVNTELVLEVLRPLWETKTETATRVRGRIERVLAAAKTQGLRSGDNPAAWRGHLDTLLPKRTKVQRVEHYAALPWKQVPVFMARLREREGITPRALEFTILTAVRTNETIGATFDEFDLDAKVWTIPAGRMKADEEHRVPLCDRCVAIVKDMQRHALNEFVFPGMKRGRPLSNMAMLMLLRDLHAGITTHGFRSSFRDWAGEATHHPHDVCEAALGHVRERKVHGAYQRGDLLEKRRRLMLDWAAFCDPTKRAKQKKAVGKIVARQMSPNDT